MVLCKQVQNSLRAGKKGLTESSFGQTMRFHGSLSRKTFLETLNLQDTFDTHLKTPYHDHVIRSLLLHSASLRRRFHAVWC